MANTTATPMALLQDDYKQKLSNGLQSHELESVELTVYWKQENMAQRARYFQGLINRDVEAFVDVVIHRALNQQGGRMFKPTDKDHLLKSVDPDVIMEMANAILGSSDDDGSGEQELEEATKN